MTAFSDYTFVESVGTWILLISERELAGELFAFGENTRTQLFVLKKDTSIQFPTAVCTLQSVVSARHYFPLHA